MADWSSIFRCNIIFNHIGINNRLPSFLSFETCCEISVHIWEKNEQIKIENQKKRKKIKLKSKCSLVFYFMLCFYWIQLISIVLKLKLRCYFRYLLKLQRQALIFVLHYTYFCLRIIQLLFLGKSKTFGSIMCSHMIKMIMIKKIDEVKRQKNLWFSFVQTIDMN